MERKIIMKKSKTDAIIFLDLENIATAKNSNVYIPFFLNLLNKKFNIKTIYSFGRLNKVKNNDLKNDLFYDKNFIKKIILENKELNSKIANLLLHILLLDNVIDFKFMNNKNELQAADKNIVNTIKNKILQNANEYKNTTIILFSVDSDFKEILNKLTQNQIINLVIGMSNTNSVCWGNLGLFRFKIEEDLFLMNKNNYLNTYFYPLISQILMKQQIFKEKNKNLKNNTEVNLLDLFFKKKINQIEKNDLEFNTDIDFQNNSDLTIQEEEKEIQIEKNDLEFNADIDFQNNSDLTIQEKEKEIQIENVFKDDIKIEEYLDIAEFDEIENDLNINNNSEMQKNFFVPVNQNQELDESPRIFINFTDGKNVESNK